MKKYKIGVYVMEIDKSKIHRIVISQDGKILVNMVYAEIGEDGYEVFGVFSGQDDGGGLFHQSSDGDITVSDDLGEFEANIDPDEVNSIFRQLERLRAMFEENDEEGNLAGLSKEGQKFLETDYNNDGYIEAYSKGASEDFIYDVQDEWNLNFFKD